MNVLLLQDVKGVGRRYEVKSVSDGYARNFLFPKKLATPATNDALKLKADAEVKEQANLKVREAQQARLTGEVLEFPLKIGVRGEAFGSVGISEIERVLRERGYAEAYLEERHNLKTTGEHMLPVNLGRGLKGHVKVIVRPEMQQHPDAGPGKAAPR